MSVNLETVELYAPQQVNQYLMAKGINGNVPSRLSNINPEIDASRYQKYLLIQQLLREGHMLHSDIRYITHVNFEYLYTANDSDLIYEFNRVPANIRPTPVQGYSLPSRPSMIRSLIDNEDILYAYGGKINIHETDFNDLVFQLIKLAPTNSSDADYLVEDLPTALENFILHFKGDWITDSDVKAIVDLLIDLKDEYKGKATNLELIVSGRVISTLNQYIK